MKCKDCKHVAYYDYPFYKYGCSAFPLKPRKGELFYRTRNGNLERECNLFEYRESNIKQIRDWRIK